ncbi:hypothetical protein NX059_009668 [Plenodomus lindquistii]|nr:hypothetical protein NX059_009668 [Plenodomus lindquistii]
MHVSKSLVAVSLLGLTQAQTPSGFVPQVDTKLDVIFNSTTVDPAGKLLSKPITATQPTIALSSDLLNVTDTYMFIMLDLDVPPANGTTERRVLLHAMITDFTAVQPNINGMSSTLRSSATGPAAYLPPGPPATDTKAHRYVELLFQQPAEFDVQASAFPTVQNRINFDLAAFATENSVNAPVAANFFTVDGRANTVASGTPTISGGGARNTSRPFEGAAARMFLPCGWAASLGAVMLLTM